MQPLVLNLFRNILITFRELEIPPPAKTRLIKILYLVEVEYYRLYKRRLTDLRWRFYHYGPYAHEIESILGNPNLEEIPFVSRDGKTGSTFNFKLDYSADNLKINSDAKRIINYIVKDWGDEDLNKLLDHVYFETEPMRDATRGDFLNFELIKPWEPPEVIKEVRIPPQKFRELKNKFQPHLSMISKAILKRKSYISLLDKSYFDCVRSWNEEQSSTQISGMVTMDLEEKNK